MDYNELAKKIYAQNKAVGWWDNPNRCLYECLQLVTTEVAEATEAERKDLMDDHLTHRKGGEVELADAMIRVLDFGAHLGLTAVNVPCIPWPMGNWSVGRKHFCINKWVVTLGDHVLHGVIDMRKVNDAYSHLLQSISMVAQSFGYDLEGALLEKLDYNAKRADHKRENRVKVGGKKF